MGVDVYVCACDTALCGRSPQEINNIVHKVNFFKYLGAIKTSTDSCSEDIKPRIGRAKKATMELDTIWTDRGNRKELKMKLVKALIWPVITFGAD